MEAWTADKTIELLNGYADSEQPFMIAANFFGPHFPYAVPAPYDTMYDPDTVERWGNFDEQFINKPLIQQKEMLRWERQPSDVARLAKGHRCLLGILYFY